MPLVLIVEAAVHHHVALKAQVVLISLARCKGLAVVLRMRIDDAVLLSTGMADAGTLQFARAPLAVEPGLRLVALGTGITVVVFQATARNAKAFAGGAMAAPGA